jgi:hypothetical protein
MAQARPELAQVGGRRGGGCGGGGCGCGCNGGGVGEWAAAGRRCRQRRQLGAPPPPRAALRSHPGAGPPRRPPGPLQPAPCRHLPGALMACPPVRPPLGRASPEPPTSLSSPTHPPRPAAPRAAGGALPAAAAAPAPARGLAAPAPAAGAGGAALAQVPRRRPAHRRGWAGPGAGGGGRPRSRGRGPGRSGRRGGAAGAARQPGRYAAGPRRRVGAVAAGPRRATGQPRRQARPHRWAAAGPLGAAPHLRAPSTCRAWCSMGTHTALGRRLHVSLTPHPPPATPRRSRCKPPHCGRRGGPAGRRSAQGAAAHPHGVHPAAGGRRRS